VLLIKVNPAAFDVGYNRLSQNDTSRRAALEPNSENGILYLGLVYKKRVIPLVWLVYKGQKGTD
jgi:hypothetical protein